MATIKKQHRDINKNNFSWLLQESMHERLLGIKRNPFLEDFLTRGSSHQPDNLALSDLLWKYHKKNNNYLAAAKILAKLAERHSTDVNLKSRVEYLSRLSSFQLTSMAPFFEPISNIGFAYRSLVR